MNEASNRMYAYVYGSLGLNVDWKAAAVVVAVTVAVALAVPRDSNVLPCKTGILNGTNTHLLCIRVHVDLHIVILYLWV